MTSILKKLKKFFKTLLGKKRKAEEEAVEIKRLTKIPREVREVLPKGYRHKRFEGYRIRFKKPPRKIRGKFKPRTALEKRLWKPDAKLEED